MEENKEQVEQEQQSYKSRPQWQIWGARVLLVIFIILIAIYYLNIARGGL